MNNTDFYYRAFNRDNSSIPKFGVDNSSIQSRGRKFNIQLNQQPQHYNLHQSSQQPFFQNPSQPFTNTIQQNAYNNNPNIIINNNNNNNNQLLQNNQGWIGQNNKSQLVQQNGQQQQLRINSQQSYNKIQQNKQQVGQSHDKLRFNVAEDNNHLFILNDISSICGNPMASQLNLSKPSIRMPVKPQIEYKNDQSDELVQYSQHVEILNEELQGMRQISNNVNKLNQRIEVMEQEIQMYKKQRDVLQEQNDRQAMEIKTYRELCEKQQIMLERMNGNNMSQMSFNRSRNNQSQISNNRHNRANSSNMSVNRSNPKPILKVKFQE